ncbi:MAG TPA: hypothetical protein VFS67_37525 [Polyangiaceae bacterium]|nr:hypothetical protein [Polyangiaceae bacterium]
MNSHPGRSRSTAALLALTLALLACKEDSEPVSTDICASGRRWIGGDTGNIEMSPGTDCVGCHLATDAPLLMAAGTVYGVTDNASQIENHCYGLEGVEVEIEGSDGQVWTTKTNRAGNFYFDGDPSWLAKPYTASFRYTTADGNLANPQMVQALPSYGGCARCHDGGRAAATPELSRGDPRFVDPVDGLFVR